MSNETEKLPSSPAVTCHSNQMHAKVSLMVGIAICLCHSTGITTHKSQTNLSVQITQFDKPVQGVGVADVSVKTETTIW